LWRKDAKTPKAMGRKQIILNMVCHVKRNLCTRIRGMPTNVSTFTSIVPLFF
jgi:hypothetical protein